MPSVTRRPHQQRAQRRDAARTRLLDVVARRLEAGESFTELSVERLAADAGMSRSTFYVYFEDKGDLLRAWYTEATAELTAAAEEWWALGADSTRKDLHGALGAILARYLPHTSLMAATADAATYDPAIRTLAQATTAASVVALRNHIRRGQKEGAVDPALLPTQTAAWLTAMAERGFHQLVRGAGQAEITKLLEAYTAIVWNTLYAPVRR